MPVNTVNAFVASCSVRLPVVTESDSVFNFNLPVCVLSCHNLAEIQVSNWFNCEICFFAKVPLIKLRSVTFCYSGIIVLFRAFLQKPFYPSKMRRRITLFLPLQPSLK
jgi:hypothetical protein